MHDSMKALVLKRFGGPEAFELMDVPVSPVGSRQVRVQVQATAVNPLDYQIRRGDYPELVPLPAIIGHDVSGVIEDVGSDVSEFGVGDEVYWSPACVGRSCGFTWAVLSPWCIGGRAAMRATYALHDR